MTTTPETPPEGNDPNKDWPEAFRRIVAEGGLVDIDASELNIETPAPDFIADYESLLAAMFTLRKTPRRKQMKSVERASIASIETLKLFVADILKETEGKQDAGHVLVELLKSANNTRANFLSAITGQTFGVMSEGMSTTLEDDFPVLLQDGVDMVDVVANLYTEHLVADTEQLTSLATQEYTNRPSTKMLNVAGVLGHHALDLAKIAAGVTVGIIVADKITRK